MVRKSIPKAVAMAVVCMVGFNTTGLALAGPQDPYGRDPKPEWVGKAGTYGAGFDGRITASGERFDMFRLTAASTNLPLGSYVEVQNLTTGATAVVKVNDRRDTSSDEILILSYAAANRIDVASTAPVRVRYLGKTTPSLASQ